MTKYTSLALFFFLLFSRTVSFGFEIPSQLSYVGGGEFKWYFINLYKAEFYSESKEFDLNKSFALKLTYHKSLKGKLIAERSGEEMLYIGFNQETADKWVKELKSIFPDIKEGESLTGYYQPGVGTTFYHQAKKIKSVEGKEFALAFFSIWLSDKTRATELRRKLLGLSQ